MSTLQNMQSTSFWKKREGKGGVALLAGLGIAGVWLGNKLLPQLITLIENLLTLTHGAIYLALSCGALAALVGFAWTNRRNFALGFKLLSRAITNIFIDVAPIAIMKEIMLKYKKKLAEAQERRDEVEAVQKEIMREQAQAERDLATANEQLEVATDERDQVLLQREIGRGQETVTEASAQVQAVGNLISAMDETIEAIKFNHDDLDGIIRHTERRYRIGKKTSAAVSSFRAAAGGDVDDDDLMQRSLEHANAVAAKGLADISAFMRDTSDMRKKKALMDGVYLNRARRLRQTLTQNRTEMLGPVQERIAIPDEETESREAVPVGAHTGRASGDTSGVFRLYDGKNRDKQ